MMLEKRQIERWLNDVVITLNLCPFAAYPWNRDLVRIVVVESDQYSDVTSQLISEIQCLSSSKAENLETTLIATPNLFDDFFEFNTFLKHANSILKREGCKGEIQIASFHPKFQFSGVDPDDKQNLTNRAPYPILHLLREASLAEAINRHPGTEQIYQRNIDFMHSLSEEKIEELFPYLNQKK